MQNEVSALKLLSNSVHLKKKTRPEPEGKFPPQKYFKRVNANPSFMCFSLTLVPQVVLGQLTPPCMCKHTGGHSVYSSRKTRKKNLNKM